MSIQEAISTSSEFFQIVQKVVCEIVATEKEKIQQSRLVLTLSYSDFLNLFLSIKTVCLLSRNQNKNFSIDGHKESVIKQFYYYLTHNSSFSGDLIKGILLQGQY